jgi:hypothetical protein
VAGAAIPFEGPLKNGEVGPTAEVLADPLTENNQNINQLRYLKDENN